MENGKGSDVGVKLVRTGQTVSGTKWAARTDRLTISLSPAPKNAEAF